MSGAGGACPGRGAQSTDGSRLWACPGRGVSDTGRGLPGRGESGGVDRQAESRLGRGALTGGLAAWGRKVARHRPSGGDREGCGARRGGGSEFADPGSVGGKRDFPCRPTLPEDLGTPTSTSQHPSRWGNTAGTSPSLRPRKLGPRLLSPSFPVRFADLSSAWHWYLRTGGAQ